MTASLDRRAFVSRLMVGGAAAGAVPGAFLDPVRGEQLVRAVAWRRVDGTGTEVCRLLGSADGPILRGVVTGTLDEEPLVVMYGVACTVDWVTRRAHITTLHRGAMRRVALVRDGGGIWRVDGRAAPTLRELWAVDLGITPATNTLPVGRLRRDGRSTATLTAAWVRFPDLQIRPLEQRYERTAPGRYVYRSRGGAYAAELEVDDVGLVIRYADVWERMA